MNRVGVSPGPRRLLIRPNEQAERTPGGIYIPETARKESATTGTVVAVPEPWLEDGEEMAPAYPIGSQVIFTKFTGTEIDIPASSKPDDRRTVRLIIMYEKDVMATVFNVPDEGEVSEYAFITEGAAEAIDTAARRL